MCFEILGFDIFLDDKLKPWILEVNHAPSFVCDTPLDTKIEKGLLTDVVKLLNLSLSNGCAKAKTAVLVAVQGSSVCGPSGFSLFCGLHHGCSSFTSVAAGLSV